MPIFALIAAEESPLINEISDFQVKFFPINQESDFDRALRSINGAIRVAEEPVKIILSAHGGIDNDGVFKFGLTPSSAAITIKDFIDKIDQGRQPLIIDLYACHAGKLFVSSAGKIDSKEKDSLKKIKILAQDSEYYSILSNRTDNCILSLNSGSKERIGDFDDYVIRKTLRNGDINFLLAEKILLPFTSKTFFKGQDGVVRYCKSKSPKILIGEDYQKLSNDNIRNHLIHSLDSLADLSEVREWISDLNLGSDFYSFYRYNALCEKVLAFDAKPLSPEKRFEIESYIKAINEFNEYGFVLTGGNQSHIEFITPMLIAAGNGSLEIIDIFGSLNVNQANKKGVAPLRMAVEAGHLECAKKLIQYGALVNLTNEDNESPLLSAASKGYYKIAELLIENGADVNCATRSGLTPLKIALKNGHADVFELLIKNGANLVGVQDYFKNAIRDKNDRALNALFKAGIVYDDKIYDPKLSDHSKENVMLIALATTDERLRSQIIKGFNQEVQNQNNQISSQEISSIEGFCYSRFYSRNKINPLSLALTSGNYEVAEFLVKRGIEAEISSEDAAKYLVSAAQNNCPHSVNFLIQKAAGDINQCDEDGLTAMAWSVINNNYEMTEAFLNAGAANNINPYDFYDFDAVKENIVLLALATEDQNIRSQIIDGFNSDKDAQDQINKNQIDQKKAEICNQVPSSEVGATSRKVLSQPQNLERLS